MMSGRHQPECRCAGERGFTLLELMVVLAALAMIATLSAPNLVKFYESARYGALINDLMTDLGKARHAAILEQQPHDFLFNFEQQVYGLSRDDIREVPESVEVDLVSAKEIQADDQWAGVRFYPDGSSSGGTLEVRKRDSARLTHIRVDWLLGSVSQWEESLYE